MMTVNKMGNAFFQAFGTRYCDGKQGKFNFETKGATNTKELSLLLQQTVMIRQVNPFLVHNHSLGSDFLYFVIMTMRL